MDGCSRSTSSGGGQARCFQGRAQTSLMPGVLRSLASVSAVFVLQGLCLLHPWSQNSFAVIAAFEAS